MPEAPLLPPPARIARKNNALRNNANPTPPSPFPAATRLHSPPAPRSPSRPGRQSSLPVGAGLHHAAGHDQRRGILGAHLDLDDLALGHIEKETRGRVRRARQEHGDMLFLAGKIVGDFFARRLRDQHDRPHARAKEIRPGRPGGNSIRCPRTAFRTPASGCGRSRAPPACARAAARRDRPASVRSGWR